MQISEHFELVFNEVLGLIRTPYISFVRKTTGSIEINKNRYSTPVRPSLRVPMIFINPKQPLITKTTMAH